jgi:signal recognition particle subunit SRP54
MFDQLTGRLSAAVAALRGRGRLTEENIAATLREVRIALLEADVALPVVKQFIADVRNKAVGVNVLKSVTPGQMVIKVVHDHLVETLGGGSEQGFNLNAVPPVVVMMVGLQGSGKTTSSAKLARLLKTRERKKVLMASLDVQRPAAQEQLAVLGRQTGVASLPVVAGEKPVAIARRALDTGRREGYDVVILDKIGRAHV